MENVNNNIVTEANEVTEEVNTIRLDSEAIDALIAEKFGGDLPNWGDICTEEQIANLRNEHMAKFDKAIGGKVDCASISKVNYVTTTSVVSYINKDLSRLDDLLALILAIGNGKPRKSNEDKLADLMAKTGMSKEDIIAMLNK